MKEKTLDLYSIKSVKDNDRIELYKHLIEKLERVLKTDKRIEVLSNKNEVMIFRRDE